MHVIQLVKVNQEVNITIRFNENSLTFEHDGLPFTYNEFLALVYRYSNGKENDTDTTGQFGTGFCSTHVLSRTVDLKTDYINSKTIKIAQKIEEINPDLFEYPEQKTELEQLLRDSSERE